MKADCPRALESCIMKLASSTLGQRGWWGEHRAAESGKHCQSLGAAKQQPDGSEMECRGEQVASALPFLGSCGVQRQSPHLWSCSNRGEKQG